MKFWISSLLLIFLFYLDIFIGSSDITFQLDFWNISQGIEGKIMRVNRLPQSVMAILAGGSLALSGLLLQSNFRNLLAGPSILGISTSSMLGVAVFFYFLGDVAHKKLSLPLFAFLGSLVVLMIIVILSRRVKSSYLLIIGLMLSFVASALIDVFKFVSSPSDLQMFSIWGLASFSNVGWLEILVVLSCLVVVFAVLQFFSRDMDKFDLGDELALSMGVNIKTLRPIILVCSGVLVAVVTAYCGPVAFIGMAVPQMIRLFNTNMTYKALLPFTFLVGGGLALFCNIIGKVPGSTIVLPLNTVTSLIGAPALIITLLKSTKFD